MDEIVREPVPSKLIQSELKPSSRIRGFRGVDIHYITADQAPGVMQEIGRIRETEFRSDGGGTGRCVDIDEFDTGPYRFGQLVAWDPEHGEIIGVYRAAHLARLTDSHGRIHSPTGQVFEFSPEFVTNYAPYTVELGRSVVNRSARRSVMGLFCVWAGLGAIVAEKPDIRYFFGKITMYPGYHERARAAISRFLNTVCPDRYGLMSPKPSLELHNEHEAEFAFDPANPDSAFECLRQQIAGFGETVPPLLISYLQLSDTMMSFGSVRNPHFGNLYETAILVTIADIRERQRSRFVDSYDPINPGILKL